MVRYDLKGDGQMDLERGGRIVQECFGFEGLDIGQIVKDCRAGTAYRLMVTVEKPK